RQILTRVEALRAEINSISRNIGTLFREKRTEEANALKAQTAEVGAEIDRRNGELREVDAALQDAMLRIPNIPEPDVPVAPDDSGTVEIKECGDEAIFEFAPLAHWEMGPKLGIIDFERGVKLSGSRFYLLMGAGTRLQRALIDFFTDVHVDDHGYE